MRLVFAIVMCTNALFAQGWKKLQEDAGKHSEKGEFAKAIQVSEKAISLALKDRNASPDAVLGLRSDNAAYYLLNMEVPKGLELFRPLLEEAETEKYPQGSYEIFQNAGLSYSYVGFRADALEYLLRAWELGEKEGVKTKPEERIACMGSIATCHQSLYHFEEAISGYEKGLELIREAKLEKSSDHAFMLSMLALCYKDMQLPAKSVETFRKAEKIFHESGDTLNPQYPVFLSDYAITLAGFEKYDVALPLLFRSRDIARKMNGENSEDYATCMGNIGYMYSKMNRTIETEQFYTAAMTIKKSLPYVRIDSYLTSVSNLMVFYSAVGRKKEALELALELEEGLKRKDFTDTLSRAVHAHNLGVRFFAESQYEKSARYYRDAIMYYTAVYGPDNQMLADIYVDMGTLFQVEEKYEECAKALNKATEIFKATIKPGDPKYILTLCQLATIIRGMDRPEEAEPAIDQAENLMNQLNARTPGNLEHVLITKAMVKGDLKKIKEAMEYFNKYLEHKYSEIEKNFSYMTENEKMFFLEEMENNIRNFYTTILSNIDEHPELIKVLLDFRIRTKGFLLNNITKIRQQILDLNDPVLNEKFETLKLKRESVAKLMSFDTKEYPYALAEASALKSEADLLEKEISLKVAAVSSNRQSQVQDWRAVQRNLSPGEAAIEVFQSYLIYDRGQGKGTNYTYIIIKEKGDPSYVTIDRTIDWENGVINAYRNSIDNRMNEGDLYRRLWQQVEEKLDGIHTVYVSPDGIYNQVNLNSLFIPAKNKYLIEEKNIHIVTTLRDIRELKQAKPFRPQNCVLIGNPKFDYDISKLPSSPPDLTGAVATRGMYGFELAELPGTKAEVEVIRTTLENNGAKAALFTEINANEAALKRISNPDVLHLATHGFFLEDPKDEDLKGYAKMEMDFYQNPMMRSGIFLSGANKNYAINTANISELKDFEDGMLTAYEAMNLKLDQTELVVLSACQTGLGKVKNGEGVFGLQRAFKLAGAKAIIMSLWPVSDEATKDLMIAFYSEWAKTGELYKAFRNAQLEVKQKYPDPYYWGAFVLYGR